METAKPVENVMRIMARHPFCMEMIPEHLNILAKCAQESAFQPGQILFREQEAAYQFYLLQEGQVALESHLPPRDILIQTLGGGDVLGWSWLFPPFVSHLQARCVKTTKAVFLDGAHLLITCEQNHAFGYDLMKRITQVLIQRLQATRRTLLKIQEKRGLPLPEGDTPNLRTASADSSPEELEAIIAEHPFLKGMNRQHLRILAESAMPVHFDSGRMVFREGDPANRFYLLQTGRVALESNTADHGAARIQIIGGGDVLGWSWLFPPYYWHFGACALEPTRAIFFYGTRLREKCDEDPELGYNLMKRVANVLIQRLQASRKQLRELQDTGGPSPT